MCGGRHSHGSTGGACGSTNRARGGTVQVRGYTRANGTYVASYTRASPRSCSTKINGKGTSNGHAVQGRSSGAGCSGSISTKTVHVRGYTRADGRYVAAYTRSLPKHSLKNTASAASSGAVGYSVSSTTSGNRTSNGSVTFPAASPCPNGSSGMKIVHVRGYTRSSGTCVDGYTRSLPSSRPRNSSTDSHHKSVSSSSASIVSGCSLLAKLPGPPERSAAISVARSVPTKSTKMSIAIPVVSVPVMMTGDGTQKVPSGFDVAKSTTKPDDMCSLSRPDNTKPTKVKDRLRISPPLDIRAKSDYYSSSQPRTAGQGSIQLLAHRSDEFSKVAKKFIKAWSGEKGRCPAVNFIFEVTNNMLEQKWMVYRSTIQEKDIKELYHGTKLTCKITTTWKLCNTASCGICGISRAGVDPQRINGGRFGTGFYLAPNSSKSHDYTLAFNGFKAILLCDVLPGKRFETQTNMQHLQSPPTGYDSVYGKVGEDLSYPELAVYKPEAILPRYIIIYRSWD